MDKRKMKFYANSLIQIKGMLQNTPAVPFRVIFLRKQTCFLRKTHRKSTGIRILQHPQKRLPFMELLN